jgi:fatty-acyl-CoA synthase
MTELLETTLGAILRDQAAKYGNKEFIVYSNLDIRYTFIDLDKKADALAKGLLAAGFKKGDHIGIWANNVPEWTTVFFAAARIGVVVAPINANYKSNELEYVLSQADLKGLFIIDRYRNSDYVEMLYQLIPELKNAEPGVLQANKFPCLKMVADIDNTLHQGMYTLDALLEKGAHIADGELKKAEALVSNEDTLLIMYTSGTTGGPKGAILTHKSVINMAYFTNRLGRVTENSAGLNPLPLFHIMSLGNGIVQSLIYGAKVAMMGIFDPLAGLATIQKEKCDWIYGVPAVFLAMVFHPEFDKFDTSSLRYGALGGADCLPEQMKLIMGKMHMKDLYIGYGITETSCIIADSWVTDAIEQDVVTLGRPIPGVELAVRDPHNIDCPPDERGEIYVRGFNVMKGYYKMEEATREAIDKDGWFHTGDIGYFLPDGRLMIDGRIKELIIRGGENIYPKEVENLLHTMPGIKDVQVVGISSKKYGEEVGAFIILKEGAAIIENDVIDFCREKISFFKIPRYVFFVDAFPATPSGKVQKFKLSETGLKAVQERGIAP